MSHESDDALVATLSMLSVGEDSNLLTEPISPMLDVWDQYSPISEITVSQISPMWLNCSFNHVVINYLECTLSIIQPNSIDCPGSWARENAN